MKKLIALVLAICMIGSSVFTASAAETEEYLSELRIVYAANKADAKEIMDENFPDENYNILDYNLNNETGKDPVWLAYKTTTDIEDAITDLAVMPMQGGYQEGNYQEMINQSREEYKEMAQIYIRAIEYFAEAYEAGDFLADCAYRQLNFYCDNGENGGELLGNLLIDVTDPLTLVPIFMEGNIYALENIRSLLAMGVSYNEDETNYMERVTENAILMDENGEEAFEEDEDFGEYDQYAQIISATISDLRVMFEELETVEDELNYEDEEVTDKEITYLSHKAVADMMREVTYSDGQTLYEFCLSYVEDVEDYTSIYPLAAALNDGQKPLVLLGNYFDVLRYSMPLMPEEEMDAEITAQEEIYGEMPFDIYTGVDRSIYTGSFALTSQAYRADASTETGLLAYLYNSNTVLVRALDHAAAAISIGSFAWAITRSVKSARHYKTFLTDKLEVLANTKWTMNQYYTTWQGYVDDMFKTYNFKLPSNATFMDKMTVLDANYMNMNVNDQLFYMDGIYDDWMESVDAVKEAYSVQHPNGYYGYYGNIGTGVLYAVGGISLIYTAVSLLISRYNYYHPDYDDIPLNMVDLIETEQGDRYIKYNAVLEAENPDAAGDLNAFAGERWNALYYSKSYEAGKPLLADFNISNNDYVPAEGYLPVHRFGENVSYNLNKFCFDDDAESIYVSVMQSERDKSAVEDVPDVIGSMLSTRYFILTAGIGCSIGIVGTLVYQKFNKKKKK